MFKTLGSVVALAAAVRAHGDHGHDQEPISGPHQGLWYNALPGDGGTQVCHWLDKPFMTTLLTDSLGGFGILGHIDLWPRSVSPLPCQR